eukprot:PhM_4_TR11697/c4_g1_i2/m.23627
MDLEHAVGCTVAPRTLHTIPSRDSTIGYLAGGCVVVADTRDVHSHHFLRGHDDDVTSLAVSHSGRLMCSGQCGVNSDVIVWDVETENVALRITEHDGGVVDAVFSPDEKMLLTIANDRRVIVWDLSNGGIIVHTSVQLAGGEAMAIAAWGGRVEDVKRRETEEYHFCVATTQRLLPFRVNPVRGTLTPLPMSLGTFTRKMTSLAYSPHNGDIMFAGSESGDIAVVTTTNYTITDVVPCCQSGVKGIWVDRGSAGAANDTNATNGSFQYARFGTNQRRSTTLYTAGGDGTITCYRIEDHNNMHLTRVSAFNAGAGCVAMSGMKDSTGRLTLVILTNEGNMFLAPVEAVSAAVPSLTQLLSSPCAPIVTLATHPTDPTRVVTSTTDGMLRQWELNTYLTNGVVRYQIAQTLCHSLCLVPGYEIMLCGWSNGHIKCHDGTNLEALWEKGGAHRSPISQIKVDPSARYFVSAAHGGEVRLWDMRTKELIQEFKEHRLEVTSLHAFGDGVHYLTTSKDRFVMMWDCRTARRVGCWEHVTGGITTSVLCPNQANFYTAGTDHKVYQWDLRAREPSRAIPYASLGSQATCHAMALNQSGRALALAGSDQVTHVLDTATHQPLTTGIAHSGTVGSMRFTCDDRQLITGGADGCMMVWNMYGDL